MAVAAPRIHASLHHDAAPVWPPACLVVRRGALERSLRLAEARGDDLVKRIVALNLIEVWIGLGMLEVAEQGCERSLKEARTRADHLSIGEALKFKGRIERERGAFEDGATTLLAALAEAKTAEDRLLHAEVLRELGELHKAKGDAQQAKEAWKDAVVEFNAAGAAGDAESLRSRLTAIA